MGGHALGVALRVRIHLADDGEPALDHGTDSDFLHDVPAKSTEIERIRRLRDIAIAE